MIKVKKLKKLKSKFRRHSVLVVITLVVVSVFALGHMFKRNRELKIKQVLEQATTNAAKPTVHDGANQPNAQAGGPKVLNLISDGRNKLGQRSVLLSEKTKEQIEAEKVQAEKVRKQVRASIATIAEQSRIESNQQRQKTFKAADVQAQISKIVAQTNISPNERSNELMKVRNLVSVSRTSTAEKNQMLAALDQQIFSIKIPKFLGFDSTLSANGELLLTPKFGQPE